MKNIYEYCSISDFEEDYLPYFEEVMNMDIKPNIGCLIDWSPVDVSYLYLDVIILDGYAYILNKKSLSIKDLDILAKFQIKCILRNPILSLSNEKRDVLKNHINNQFHTLMWESVNQKSDGQLCSNPIKLPYKTI